MKKKDGESKYNKKFIIWYHTILMALMGVLFLVYFLIRVNEIRTSCGLESCPDGPAITLLMQARTEAMMSFGFGMMFVIAAITYNHTKRFID